MVDGSEADVVLLHDGRVEGVEVEKEDEAIIEASLGLKNQTPGVGRFSPTMPPATGGPLGGLLFVSTLSYVSLIPSHVRERNLIMSRKLN